ncbi:MAG: DUF2637 domain-containing protein [Chloroflexi bacterium]|nr:DUF2637 domain-containing protein [Chloroflexota bacterium]
MSKANKLISISTGVLVAFLAGGAFWLSFDALKDLAAGNGIASGMAWLYPAIIDGAIIVFSLSVLQASLNRDKTLYPWALVAIFTVLSVVLNIVHAPQDFLPRILAAIPPVALFLSFELLMNQVKGTVRRAAAFQSLHDLAVKIRQKQTELDELVQSRTADLDKLNATIERMTAQKETLQAELRDLRSERRQTQTSSYLGTLDHANAVRVANKTEAQDALLAYLADHPDASLAEAGAAIGRSKSTIGVYVRELSESGQLHKNGHGWEIVDEE